MAVERVRAFVRAELGRVLDGTPTTLPDGEVDHDTLAALADGELGRFLRAREGVVTSLVAEVCEAVEAAGASRVVPMDMAGATLGYATGTPTGPPAPASAWREGFDPARLRGDLAAYRTLVPPARERSVALRPMLPDCDSAANLTAKVALLREFDVAWADFYHYGFMRLDALDWIREAMAER